MKYRSLTSYRNPTIPTAPKPSFLTTKLSKQLIKRMTPKDPNAFLGVGDLLEDTADGPVIFQDNGASILGVAHLDWVEWQQPKLNGGIVRGGQLDDRIGVWILLDVLKRIDIKCDILLTDSEEVGKSTAQHFPKTKDYNWIFEFDRMGTDVVSYCYETPEWSDTLSGVGFDVGIGAFTDICYLEHLHCKGVNIGTGYHYQHTPNCYADLNETLQMLCLFSEFYEQYKDVHFEHEPSVYNDFDDADEYADWFTRNYSATGSTSSRWRDDDDGSNYCWNCGEPQLWWKNTPYCVRCDKQDLLRLIK